MAAFLRQRKVRLAPLYLSLALASCASAVESSKLEDSARRTVPVPICIKPLARHGASGVISALTPEDYWSMILPSFDASAGTVDTAAPDCSGRQLLTDPELFQAEGPRTGPIRVTAADVSVNSGPDGFKAVWLRTHRFSGGSAAGPIALVRAREAYAEVYAIGLYRGNAARSRFAFERMGAEILVTATDDGCTDVKPNQGCETTLTALLLSNGQLLPGARFALDRIQYGQAAGATGTAQFRLTATPVFQDKSIRVVEQIVVRDPTQGEIRKSDLERVYKIKHRSTLVADKESLWAQMVGTAQPAKTDSKDTPTNK